MSEGLLLTRQWRDDRQHLVLELWFATESGPQYVEIRGERPVFFVSIDPLDRRLGPLGAAEVRPLALLNYENTPVVALYFNSWRAHQRAARQLIDQGLAVYESDVRPPQRYLMERFIKGFARWSTGHRDALGGLHNPVLQAAPKVDVPLRVVSVDIETTLEHDQVLSIAVATNCGQTKVWLNSSRHGENYLACTSEAGCIKSFLDFIAEYDPDVITGWNLIAFDLWVLQQRCDALRLEFLVGRRASVPQWREDAQGRRYVYVAGRSIIDAMDSIKAAGYHFDSFRLDDVARSLLGEGKLIAEGHDVDELMRWYQQDPERFVRYNLVDADLVLQIIETTKLLSYLIERASLTGAELHRVGGSVMQFEFMYLPLMHRAGYVAPMLGERQFQEMSPGGYVMESKPGLFSNVLVLDFKSLYPSIIRTFKVDPVALWRAKAGGADVVPGMAGASFDRNAAILPGVIDQLWQARDVAKAESNLAASTALKIIMNSCYGVLGSPTCRFFDPALSSSITMRGHQILQLTAEWIEERGWRVIYGDTDSVFVLLGDECEAPWQVGDELQDALNAQWRDYLSAEYSIDSHLELEFETCFKTFFMPTMRHTEVGSKKRYAGLSVARDGAESMVFKGLENVRSDWTVFAKRTQSELFERVFHHREWRSWLSERLAALYRGELDSELLYVRKLRKPIESYVKMVPPHVQAARQLRREPRRGEAISYIMTTAGVLHSDLLVEATNYDYDHYMEKQMAPAVDSLLSVLGTSLDEVSGMQMGLKF